MSFAHTLSHKLDAMKTTATEELESPLERIHSLAKGKLEVIEAIEDDLFKVEDALDKLREANSRRDRHSGFGRGDSMG